MFSLAGTIDHFAPRLSPPLVAPAALVALRRVARQLPATMTHWIDIECRLAAGQPGVDLIVKIDRRRRELLAREPWPRLRELARAWTDSTTTVHRGVSAVWLEFDIDPGVSATGGGGALRPRVFIDLARDAYVSSARDCRLTTILDAVAPLTDEPAPTWLRRGLDTCLSHLPPDAYLLYIGLPAEDHIRHVRVCVIGLGEHRIAGYLRAVGWPGDRARLRQHLARTSGAQPTIVHLNLGPDGVPPALGFEYSFARRPQVRGTIEEHGFLDRLVAAGLCDDDKRRALLEWPGCAIETLPHALWPAVVVRRVSHVKIVYDPPSTVEAKAYLCGSHEWRPAVQRLVACL
jgi:hypothetical protein